MHNTRTFTDKLFLFIKGLGMGAANKVPGVSGGVVAFVAGFYEEFIYSLQRVNKTAFKLLFNGRFKSFYSYINGPFLSILFLGMVVSFFTVSKVLDYFLTHNELYVWSLFFGMIIGSIYYIYKDFKEWNFKTIAAFIIGISLGISVSFFEPATQNDNLWFVFFCGIISVSGMTLPGFSGSFIMMLFGNYVLLLVDSVNSLSDTVYELIKGDFSFVDNQPRLRLLQVLAVFTTGSVTGLVIFSHILTYILKHYKSITISSIIGFIVGSLGVVWPWKKTLYQLSETDEMLLDSSGAKIVATYQRFMPELTTETFFAIGYILFGILIVLALEWYGYKTKKAHA